MHPATITVDVGSWMHAEEPNFRTQNAVIYLALCNACLLLPWNGSKCQCCKQGYNGKCSQHSSSRPMPVELLSVLSPKPYVRHTTAVACRTYILASLAVQGEAHNQLYCQTPRLRCAAA